MKIEQQNVAGSTQATSLTPLTSGQRSYASASSGGDQAELSGVSKAIQSFQSDRAARVDRLTALVRSGKYDVSPSLISGSIVSEALSSGSSPAGAASR